MKPTITGGRFSRKASVTFRNGMTRKKYDEAEKAASKLGGWVTFEEGVVFWSEIAVAILEANDLPCDALVSYIPGTTVWKIGERPDDNFFWITSTIDEYIIRELDKEHDSKVGIAARILTIADHLKNKRLEPLLLAYELGSITKLLEAVSITSKQGGPGGHASKGKECFIKLATYLVNSDPSLKDTEYWNLIPEEGSPKLLGCYRSINEDGDEYLHCSNNGKAKKIKSRTFRGHISKVKPDKNVATCEK